MTLIQVSKEQFQAMLNNAVKEAVKQATPPAPTKQLRDLITPREAAKLAGVSLGTIYGRVKDKTLTKYDQCGKMYRVSRKQVESMFCKPQ